MKANALPTKIKNNVKITFKERLKEINIFYKKNTPKDLLKKWKGREGGIIIEKMIYDILKKGYIETEKNIKQSEKNYLTLLNNQLEKIIYDKNKVEIEKRLPTLEKKHAKHKRIDLIYDNEIIEIKNVDFTKHGKVGTTLILIDYFYQIIEYIIIAKINNWKIENYFTLWLPRYNVIRRFNIDEKLINKWVKWYKVVNND